MIFRSRYNYCCKDGGQLVKNNKVLAAALTTPRLTCVTTANERRKCCLAASHMDETAASSKCYFDGIFIINLDRRRDRWNRMVSELEKAKMLLSFDDKEPISSCLQHISTAATVNIERYSAVEGSALTADKLYHHGFLSRLGKRRLMENERNKIWGMDVNHGAMGCALSHIELWSLIRARRLHCALILEDDCEFSQSFLPDFETLVAQHVFHMEENSHDDVTTNFSEKGKGQQMNSNDGETDILVGKKSSPHLRPSSSSLSLRYRFPWDLIYLSGLDTEGRQPFLPEVAPGIKFVPRMHRTTNAYITHWQGCEQLLANCVPLTYQLDTEMTLRTTEVKGMEQVGGVEHVVTQPLCFSVVPSLIQQDRSQASDIQDYCSKNHLN